MMVGLLRTAVPLVNVLGAGIVCVPGEHVHPLAVEALKRSGYDTCDGSVSQRLDKQLVAASRLILSATREHRTEVVRLDPTAAMRAFTVRELGRLLREQAPASNGDRIVAVLRAANTALADDPPDQDDDLADPIGLPYEQFENCLHEIETALEPLIRALRTESTQR